MRQYRIRASRCLNYLGEAQYVCFLKLTVIKDYMSKPAYNKFSSRFVLVSVLLSTGVRVSTILTTPGNRTSTMGIRTTTRITPIGCVVSGNH